MLLLLALAPLHAAAWYDPGGVAAQSRAFADASAAVGPRYEAAEVALARYGAALEELELGVALAGSRVPAEQAAWATEARLQVTAQFLTLQKHVDLMAEDYERVFLAAVGRALAALPGGAEAVSCEPRRLMGRVVSSPCPGTDLTPRVAAAVDQDAALLRALQEIAEVPWPEVGVAPRAFAPLPLEGAPAAPDHLHLAPLVRALAPEALARRKDAMADATLAAEAAVEQQDAATLAALQGAKQSWLAALGRDGDAILAVLPDALARAGKAGASAAVGLCVNPALLGGCTGADRSAALTPVLQADKKVQKAVARLP
jgi:hypothetical protein